MLDPTLWDQRALVASWQRYREAARWKLGLWIVDAGLFLAGLVLWGISGSSVGLGSAAAVYLLLKRVVVDPEQTRAHGDAVRLQEEAEVARFRLSWNESLAGRRMSEADVAAAELRYRGDPDRFRTWYAGIDGLPHGATVLLAQWQNASWARRDHRRFATFIGLVLLFSIAVTMVLGTLRDATLGDYLIGLAMPSMPWFLDLADLAGLNSRASRGRAAIERQVSEALDRAAAGSGPDDATLRNIQDALYRSRSEVGHVPDWFYRWGRRANRELYDRAVAHLSQPFRMDHAE